MTYRPYAVDGRTPPGLAVSLPDARPDAVETFELGPVSLQVFTPLAQVMAEAAALPSAAQPYRPEAAACDDMAVADLPPLELPSANPGCADAGAPFRSLMKRGAALCADLAQPERAVLRGEPGDLADAELGSIPGLVAYAGRALSEIRFPRALYDDRRQASLRRIMGKIRLPELERAAAGFARSAADLDAGSGGVACAVPPAARARLDGLRHRIAALLAERQRIAAAGRAQAAAEEAALRAAGRERGALPYPSLTAPERAELSMLLGGIYWRMRGGGLVLEPDGTQATRYHYNALPMAAIGALNGGAEGYAAGMAIFSRIFEGWGIWMDMGRTPGGDGPLADLAGMTARGARQVGIAAPMLAAGGYDPAWLTVGGLHLGPVYYYAWERLDGVKVGADLAPPLQPFLEGPTAWGEALGGAAIAYGFARSLLAGRPIPVQGPPLEGIGR